MRKRLVTLVVISVSTWNPVRSQENPPPPRRAAQESSTSIARPLPRPPGYPWLDVSAYGVDCTGSSDSSAALNALTGTQDTSTGKILLIPQGCNIRLNSTWNVYGQEFLTIDGLGGINATSGARVFGCGGSAGPVILISRSGFTRLNGFSVEAKGPSCSSNFTESIETANSASGGYTTTDLQFTNMALSSSWNGGAVVGYVGLHISGTPNQELFQISQSIINCQNSSSSFGIWSNDGNADSTEIAHAGINSCYRGIYAQAGIFYVHNSNVSGNGGFSVFGSGGATLYEGGGCIRTFEDSVVAEGSGQFLNANGDTGGCGYHFFRGNQISFQDIDPSVYPVNVSGQAGPNGTAGLVLIGNSFTRVGATVHNDTLVGSDSQGGGTIWGPLGSFYSFGNTWDTANLEGPHPFQNGQLNLDIMPNNAALYLNGLGNFVAPAFAPSISGTSVLKGNGTGGTTSALASDVTATLGYTPPATSGAPKTGNCAAWASATSIGDAGSPCGGGGGTDKLISVYFNGGFSNYSPITFFPSPPLGMTVTRMFVNSGGNAPTCSVAPTISIQQYNGSTWTTLQTISFANSPTGGGNVYGDSGVVSISITAGQPLAWSTTNGTCSPGPSISTVYIQYR